jgi:hypothetical protein
MACTTHLLSIFAHCTGVSQVYTHLSITSLALTLSSARPCMCEENIRKHSAGWVCCVHWLVRHWRTTPARRDISFVRPYGSSKLGRAEFPRRCLSCSCTPVWFCPYMFHVIQSNSSQSNHELGTEASKRFWGTLHIQSITHVHEGNHKTSTLVMGFVR